MPPTLPTTNDSTSTPKRSSRRLTPAVAPLSANTKVPRRSSTNKSVVIAVAVPSGRITIYTSWASIGNVYRLRRHQPGPRGNNQCFHARLKGGMNNRCEAGAVVDRNFVKATCFLGLCVRVGVCAADKPEYRWDVPLGSERTEVLARWRRSSLPDAVGREVSAERIDDSRARLRVIH